MKSLNVELLLSFLWYFLFYGIFICAVT